MITLKKLSRPKFWRVTLFLVLIVILVVLLSSFRAANKPSVNKKDSAQIVNFGLVRTDK